MVGGNWTGHAVWRCEALYCTVLYYSTQYGVYPSTVRVRVMNLISYPTYLFIDRRNLSASVDINIFCMQLWIFSMGTHWQWSHVSVDGQWSVVPAPTLLWAGQVPGGKVCPLPTLAPSCLPPLSWPKSTSQETGPANVCFYFIAHSAIYDYL